MKMDIELNWMKSETVAYFIKLFKYIKEFSLFH